MKKPDLAAIPDPTPETSFAERAKAAKKDAVRKKSVAVKRSFTLLPEDDKYIDQIALKRGMERGKPMSASEALRHIIDEHRGRTS